MKYFPADKYHMPTNEKPDPIYYGSKLKTKQRTNKRNNARKRMGEILRFHGSVCYICKEPVASLRLENKKPGRVVSIIRQGWIVLKDIDGSIYEIRQATIDHVVPLVKGGSNDLSNTVPCCWHCNNNKSDRDAS